MVDGNEIEMQLYDAIHDKTLDDDEYIAATARAMKVLVPAYELFQREEANRDTKNSTITMAMVNATAVLVSAFLISVTKEGQEKQASAYMAKHFSDILRNAVASMSDAKPEMMKGLRK
jgi:hypothetical protein